jgi:hypothetical protein
MKKIPYHNEAEAFLNSHFIWFCEILFFYANIIHIVKEDYIYALSFNRSKTILDWFKTFWTLLKEQKSVLKSNFWTYPNRPIERQGINFDLIAIGQIKPKAVWTRHRFSQNTNKRICFVCREKQKIRQIRSFVFWENLRLAILLSVLSDL